VAPKPRKPYTHKVHPVPKSKKVSDEYNFEYDPAIHSKREIKLRKRQDGDPTAIPVSYVPDGSKVAATQLNEVSVERPAPEAMRGPDLEPLEVFSRQLWGEAPFSTPESRAAFDSIAKSFLTRENKEDPNPPKPGTVTTEAGVEELTTEPKFVLDKAHVVHTCDLVRFKLNMIYVEYEAMWAHLNEQQAYSLAQIEAMIDLPFIKQLLPPELLAAKKLRIFNHYEQCKKSANESLRANVITIYKKFKDIKHPTLSIPASRILRVWYSHNIRNPYPSEDLKRLLAFKVRPLLSCVRIWLTV